MSSVNDLRDFDVPVQRPKPIDRMSARQQDPKIQPHSLQRLESSSTSCRPQQTRGVSTDLLGVRGVAKRRAVIGDGVVGAAGITNG